MVGKSGDLDIGWKVCSGKCNLAELLGWHALRKGFVRRIATKDNFWGGRMLLGGCVTSNIRMEEPDLKTDGGTVEVVRCMDVIY
jgi:hypothetical protein